MREDPTRAVFNWCRDQDLVLPLITGLNFKLEVEGSAYLIDQSSTSRQPGLFSKQKDFWTISNIRKWFHCEKYMCQAFSDTTPTPLLWDRLKDRSTLLAEDPDPDEWPSLMSTTQDDRQAELRTSTHRTLVLTRALQCSSAHSTKELRSMNSTPQWTPLACSKAFAILSE